MFYIAGTIILIILILVVNYNVVPNNKAIVRTGVRGKKVALNSIIVLPLLHKKLLVDTGINKFEIKFLEDSHLVSKDKINYEATIAILLQIKEDEKSILEALEKYTTLETLDQKKLESLLKERIDSTVRNVSKNFVYQQMEDRDIRYKKALIEGLKREDIKLEITDLNIDYLYKIEKI